MSSLDDYVEKTLFVCQNDVCAQFYLLSVAPSAKKQGCPKSKSHGPMMEVTEKSKWAQWNTCKTDGCKSYLSTVADDGKGRCLHCNKLLVVAGELELDELPDYDPGDGEDEVLDSTLRKLSSKSKENKDWTSSHHPDYTSTGKKKSGGSGARERHTGADHQNAIQAQVKIAALNRALTAAIKQRLKKGQSITSTELKKYKKLVTEARKAIVRLGGTPVTETSVAADLEED